MAGWYPGAVKIDVGGNGNRITARPPENVLHIAASSWNVNVDHPTDLSGISGWIEQGSTEAHTYNDQFGYMLQYCDLFLAVDGTKDGNWRNRTHEAWNPPTGDLNESGYTPEQCERFSDFLAWDHNANGTLLQDMRDSRTSSHGVGAHRYGITAYSPWNQVGGEVWSTSSNKLCPGTARVKQLNAIIRRAQFIVDHNLGTLPPGRVNLEQALSRGNQEPFTVGQYEEIMKRLDAIDKKVNDTQIRVRGVDTGPNQRHEGFDMLQDILSLCIDTQLRVRGVDSAPGQDHADFDILQDMLDRLKKLAAPKA